MRSIWSEAVRILSEGGKFVLAAVASRQGSAPGAVGSVMLVKEDGSFLGSVGGGKVEAMSLDAAKELFTIGGWRLLEVDLAGKQAAEAGMICGGRTEIFLDLAGRGDLAAFEVARQCNAANGRGYLNYDLDARPRTLTFDDESGGGGESDGRLISIPMRGNGTLYVFGGGHVGYETARIGDMVGFKTVVLDDRESFVNEKRFPEATPILLDSFENIPDLNIDANSYLVIVTRGHLHDLTVLDFALRTDAGYIGMIGSRRKRDMVYRHMMEKGHSRESLDRVHSPIGLEIGSETPAEIAISIIAELIRARASATGRM